MPLVEKQPEKIAGGTAISNTELRSEAKVEEAGLYFGRRTAVYDLCVPLTNEFE